MTADEIPYDLLFSKNEKNEISCISAVCTHRPVLMSKACRTGNQIRCCSHGAIFDITSGKVLLSPATENLRFGLDFTYLRHFMF